MQRRKHIQLDLRVSFIPCRAKGYCEERQIQKEEKGSNNKPPGLGSRDRKKGQKQGIWKKEILYVSFDFLFPDSPYDLFCYENVNGKKSIILELKSQLDAFHG